MFRTCIKGIIHPVFLYITIAMLECISYGNQKVILHEMPKKGDNFSTLTNQAVYYFNGVGKYSYTSPECYLRLGNPPFSTNYKEGGIKTIDKSIADSIPFLGSMCSEIKVKTEKKGDYNSVKRFLSTNYLLDHFSNLSHVLSYMILSFSIVFFFRSRTTKYWIAFWASFLGGGLLEIVQHYFIVGRTATYEDQLLNSIGAIVGVIFFWVFRKLAFLKWN